VENGLCKDSEAALYAAPRCLVTLTQMNQLGRRDLRLGCHNLTPFSECCGAGLTKSSARD